MTNHVTLENNLILKYFGTAREGTSDLFDNMKSLNVFKKRRLELETLSALIAKTVTFLFTLQFMFLNYVFVILHAAELGTSYIVLRVLMSLHYMCSYECLDKIFSTI